MVQLASAAVNLGDPRRAALIHARLIPHANIFDFFGSEGSPAGPIAFWLGSLATTMGEFATAESWFDVADELNRRLGAVLFTQYSTIGRAKVLLLKSPLEAARARELVQGVLDFADRTGAGWLRASVDALERDVNTLRQKLETDARLHLRSLH